MHNEKVFLPDFQLKKPQNITLQSEVHGHDFTQYSNSYRWLPTFYSFCTIKWWNPLSYDKTVENHGNITGARWKMWVLKSFRTMILGILPKAFFEAYKDLEHSSICCTFSSLAESVQCCMQQEILWLFWVFLWVVKWNIIFYRQLWNEKMGYNSLWNTLILILRKDSNKAFKKGLFYNTCWYFLQLIHFNIHGGYSECWGCFLRKHLVLTTTQSSSLEQMDHCCTMSLFSVSKFRQMK